MSNNSTWASLWAASSAIRAADELGRLSNNERIWLLAQLQTQALDPETKARVDRLLAEEVRKIDPKEQSKEHYARFKAILIGLLLFFGVSF